MFDIPQQRFPDLNKLPVSISLGSFTAEFLYWGFFPPEYWRNYLHIHSFFEICYAFQGVGTFRIDDDEKPVQAGDLFVAKPGEAHEILSSKDDPLGIYFWAYTLLPRRSLSPSGDSTKLLLRKSEESSLIFFAEELDQLLHAFGDTRCWVSNKTGATATVLKLLTHEIALRRPGYMQSIHSLAKTLLIETARAVVNPSVHNPPLPELNDDRIDETVAKIVRYLKDNYIRPLQVRDVAAQLHLSERHTSRLFRKAMGMPIQEYLTQLRITMAKQHLLDPTKSIAEIADATGYPDARYFSTLFRSQTGVTPTAFRKGYSTEFLNERI